jgi:osmotically-inducible protein OsmY
MIARNPTTESFQINATVNNAIVLITGKADSWAERDLATTIAKSIPGVREVRNKIEVVFAKSRPDKEIERDVRSRLIWDTLVDDELIFSSTSKMAWSFSRAPSEASWSRAAHGLMPGYLG